MAPDAPGPRGRPPWTDGGPGLPPDFVPFDPVDLEGSLADRFRAIAARHPDADALRAPAGTLSYAELDRRSEAVAHDLVGRQPGPPEPVALLLDHDGPLVTAILGLAKAARIVLVLDPMAPDELNRAVLADSGARLLVADRSHLDQAGRLAEGAAPPEVVSIDDLGVGPVDGPVDVHPGPDTPLLLAYTSGTTGAPKAATVPNRAMLEVMRGATDALGISPSDSLPMLFPVSLAVAAYPMFLPLVNGAALALFDMRSQGLGPFPDWLRAERITVMYMSPTVARFMVEPSDGEGPTDLRLVVLGGERVDDDAVATVRKVLGDACLVANGYGTTETGVLTFFYTEPGARYGATGVPVGLPIEGMALELLDDRGQPAAPGAPGEIVVTSRYLFDGYWRHPDLDAEVLTRSADGTGTYRTGDLGRFEPDGCLVLLGRSDTEVKVRGHRIVPGEVEQALLSLPVVGDAVVDARPGRRGLDELVAWVVPAEGRPAGPELASEVRDGLREIVRSAMVPGQIVVLDALPLLPNGKLDRQALPNPAAVVGEREVTSPPRDDLERALVDIWQRVLGVSAIGVDDDFTDLGGQSLDAAWMLVLLEDEQGVRVPMSDLLHLSTVADLAAHVRGGSPGAGPSTVVVNAGDPSRPTLFFAHDLHGSGYGLRLMVDALGADQPLVGFESPLLTGPPSPFATLDELAAFYVADVVRHQPEGPYHLAGYSFGGVLAFEMARQLSLMGYEVAFLGVVDVGPGYRGRHFDPRKVLDKPWMKVPHPPGPEVGAADRARFYTDLVRRSPAEAAQHVLLRTGLDRWTDELVFRRDLRRTGRIEPEHRLWYGWRQHWALARRYDWEGRHLPGTVTLFWCDETAATDGTMGWSAVADRVEIEHISVLHEVMMKPEGVAVLGPALRRALDRSVSGPPGC